MNEKKKTKQNMSLRKIKRTERAEGKWNVSFSFLVLVMISTSCSLCGQRISVHQSAAQQVNGQFTKPRGANVFQNISLFFVFYAGILEKGKYSMSDREKERVWGEKTHLCK